MSLIVLLALNCNRTEQETTNNETDIAEQETRKEKSRCRGHCRAANRHAPAMCDFPRRRRGKRPRWNPPRKGGGKSDKGAALAHNEDAARAVGRAKRKERAASGLLSDTWVRRKTQSPVMRALLRRARWRVRPRSVVVHTSPRVKQGVLRERARRS